MSYTVRREGGLNERVCDFFSRRLGMLSVELKKKRAEEENCRERGKEVEG